MSRIRANQKTIHWILTQIWTKFCKFTNLQKKKHEITRISWSYQDIIPLHHIPFKRWLPLSFRSVPLPPDFSTRPLCFAPWFLSTNWTQWNHRVLRKTQKNPRLYEDSPPKQGFQSVGFSSVKWPLLWRQQEIQDSMTLVILTVWTGIDEKHDPWFQRTVWFMSTQNSEQYSVSPKEFESWDQQDRSTTMTPNS